MVRLLTLLLTCIAALANPYLGLMSAGGSSSQTKPSTNNLVEYWEMSAGLGADETGAHRAYTLDDNNSIGSNATGGVDGGVARNFDNPTSDYFDSNGTATGVKALTNNFTRMGYFRWEGDGDGAVKVIQSLFDTGANQRQIRIHLDANEVFTVLLSTNLTAAQYTVTNSATITSNINYFYAVIRSGTTLSTCVTQVGQPLQSFQNSTIGSEALATSTADLIVGASLSSGSATLFWDGRQDKLGFYSAALTEAEVRWWYNETGGGVGRTYSEIIAP